MSSSVLPSPVEFSGSSLAARSITTSSSSRSTSQSSETESMKRRIETRSYLWLGGQSSRGSSLTSKSGGVVSSMVTSTVSLSIPSRLSVTVRMIRCTPRGRET